MPKLTKKEKEEKHYQFLVNLGKEYSKKNRENATKWETRLFKILSDLPYRFQYQVPHIHKGKVQKLYVLDFLLTDYNIVIEVDSKQHHSSKADIKADNQRTRHLKKDGFIVYRLWNAQISTLSDKELKEIINTFVK